MITQRMNSFEKWRGNSKKNSYFLGFIDLLTYLSNKLPNQDYKMIEIGSYMGESTMLFASTGIFSSIYSIDPHDGDEEFNELFNYDWNFVISEYNKNTRFFDCITHIKDFSYNVYNKFEDGSIDFIYIDGNHSYESIKQDLQLYLPKLKSNGIISGHDYFEGRWPETVTAINEMIGEPDVVFSDSSWVKSFRKNEII